jgi:hypothetical protein
VNAYEATFALCVAELRGEVSLREDLAVTEWSTEPYETPWGLELEARHDDDESTFARAYGIVLHAGADDVLDTLEAP